jgi:hypothetical protein
VASGAAPAVADGGGSGFRCNDQARSSNAGRIIMFYRSLAGALALAAALVVTVGARAEDAKYPNWKGQWDAINPRFGGQAIKYDPTKAWGPAQQAPLTPEYQKVLADSMADQAKGGLGNYPTARCLPGGMPRMMASPVQEYIITPETTYIVAGIELRRIFTDGRDWPSNAEPTYQGYSIGRWIDEDGDGRYDVLDAETRHFKGPRAFDASGLPLAFDNQSVFKERFFIDKTNPDIIHVLTTVIDNALTRPWTSDRQYMRFSENPVQWPETWCQEGNANVVIGKENYFLRADGVLMPAKKNQAPPDLRYFNQSQK